MLCPQEERLRRDQESSMQDCRNVNLQDGQARPCQSPLGRHRHLHPEEARRSVPVHPQHGRSQRPPPGIPARKCSSFGNGRGRRTDARVQLDVTDDGFLSLMSDDGSTKDDVKLPASEAGDKIKRLFTEEGKDTSKLSVRWNFVRRTYEIADVIVLTAMGEEVAIDAKEAPKG